MSKTVVVLIVAASALGVALVVRGQLRDRSESTPANAPVLAPVQVQRPDVPAVEPPVTLPSSPTPPQPTAELPAPTVGEQETDAATVLKGAATAYSSVRAMRADFSQWQENPLLGKRTTSRGTVYQRQPDRFLMKFSQPDGDVIVSDGEYFWLYYPSVDAKQVLRSRAADVGGLDLQAQFIGDPTKRYNYTDQGAEEVAGRPARVITLVPKEAAGYKSLKVWIDQRDHLVRRFELTMENGVRQHFDLNNLQINPTLSNDLFRFTPPPGARIIDR
ncbi:MAG: outer membrane lipoprotein carrier protein LolA [Gemmatimonadota bacterium]